MSKECITNCKLEDTGFNYTMSLIQGKYKMFILYTLMEFEVVRFNEMQKVYRWNHIQNTQFYSKTIRSVWSYQS